MAEEDNGRLSLLARFDDLFIEGEARRAKEEKKKREGGERVGGNERGRRMCDLRKRQVRCSVREKREFSPHQLPRGFFVRQ